MAECKGFIDSVYCGSGVDGNGLRVVIFFSGCNLRCGFCHNPETLYKKGSEVTADELYRKCLRYRGYIKRGGVTLSGGEPFIQKDFCLELIKLLHSANIDVIIETNGHIADGDLIAAADSFIVDVKNQETNGVGVYETFLSTCDELGKPVVLTNVIVPQKNGSLEKFAEVQKLKKHSCVLRIKPLPFHKMCEEKYENLHIEFPYSLYREAESADLEILQK